MINLLLFFEVSPPPYSRAWLACVQCHVRYRCFCHCDGHALLPQVAFSPLGPLLTFASNAVTRKFEFAADHFAAALGYTKHLQSGLVKVGGFV